MALSIGNKQASDGMTQAVYKAIDAELRPPMEQQGAEPALVQESQEAWKKLAFAISKGVIEYITANMEIVGIQTHGNINAIVQGATGTSDLGNHQHSINLSSVQNNIIFTQSNDGIGHVK